MLPTLKFLITYGKTISLMIKMLHFFIKNKYISLNIFYYNYLLKNKLNFYELFQSTSNILLSLNILMM